MRRQKKILNCIYSLIEISECNATLVTKIFCTYMKKPLECFPIHFKRWDRIKNERLKEELLKVFNSFPKIEIIYENKEKKPES